MQHQEFHIGLEFEHLGNKFRVVDIGQTTVAAVLIDNVEIVTHLYGLESQPASAFITAEEADAHGLFTGPDYGVALHSFGPSEIEECRPWEEETVRSESLIEGIFGWCDRIKNGRTVEDIWRHLTTDEMRELEDELVLHSKNREPGPDGVVGEAIDAILCLVDLIRTASPETTPGDLAAIADKKCRKWAANYADTPGKPATETTPRDTQAETTPSLTDAGSSDSELAGDHPRSLGWGKKPNLEDLARAAATGPEEAQRILDQWRNAAPDLRAWSDTMDRAKLEQKAKVRVDSMIRATQVTFVVHSALEKETLVRHMARAGYALDKSHTDNRDTPTAKIAHAGTQILFREIGKTPEYVAANNRRVAFIGMQSELEYRIDSVQELDDLTARLASLGFSLVDTDLLSGGVVSVLFRAHAPVSPSSESENSERADV